MDILLSQLILAGPGDDSDGWMNILLVLVLAVFWIVSGIIKATSQKPQDSQKKQPPMRKPVRKVPPPTTARGPSGRPTKTVQARPQPRPRPATPAIEAGKVLRSKTVQARRKLESPPSKPQVGPILQDLPEFASKPLIELDHMRLGVPDQTTEAEDLPELVLDFADPDELIKAILHYEILGPPVSLRNPSNQITVF